MADERPRIALIYTGGTLGMLHNAKGSLEPAPGYLATQMSIMPELKDPKLPTYKYIEYSPLLDSSDMEPSHWIKIASDIEANYAEVDGFVVVMGTDTMGYCASGLSFLLQNLGKPVILTGGAVPLCEVYNDSRRNLIVSMLFAISPVLCEVCVFFNDVLLRGNRTIKVSSESLNAFHSPNYPPLATLSTTNFLHPHLRKERLLDPPKGRLIVHKKLDMKVFVIKLIPGFDEIGLLSLVQDPKCDVRAFLLETYGTGNAPTRKQSLMDFIRIATEKNIIVVIVSQVLHGAVNLGSYEVGRKLMEVGVMSAGDMTTAATATKLAYLFGRGLDNTAVRQMLLTNLRG
eukprot:PhF_6_TR26976/c0_g1_i4/m.39365/K01424/E3.5.1.1, ansA, ansB; L-asparaginase